MRAPAFLTNLRSSAATDAPSRRAAMPGTPPPPPPNRRSRLARRRSPLLLLAAALAALAVFFAPGGQPAQAQTTTVWLATLAVMDIGTSLLGCDNALGGSSDCRTTSVLTDDDFTYDGTVYHITAIRSLASSGAFAIEIDKAIPASLKSALTLRVDNRQFALAGARVTGSSASWPSAGLSWSVGDTVQLRLFDPSTVSADAGPDQTTATGATVTLDGSGSFVASGATPTYAWTQTGGTSVTLSNSAAVSPTFTAPSTPRTLTFRLTISHDGVTSTDTVTITIRRPSGTYTGHGGTTTSPSLGVQTVNKVDGGTARYLSMHFTGEDESRTFSYRLAEQPSGTITVDFLTMVQSAGYGRPGYTWDWQAVSVSPRTLTFTATNWSTTQTVNLVSQIDDDGTPEQVIIVIRTSIPREQGDPYGYAGIHVTVDDDMSSFGLRVTEAPTDYVVPGYTKPGGSPGSIGDGAVGRQPPASPPDQQTGRAPRGTAGQAPDSGEGNGNRGNGDPPPSGVAPPDEQEPPAEDAEEQTAEEKLIADLAGDDGCISQDERMAGATRIQNVDLRAIDQSQAYRLFRAAYC